VSEAVHELVHDAAWRRLDLRMLLVHPVNEVVRFLPLLVGLFFLGRSNTEDPWHYLGVAIPIALGLLRFASTTFRITGTQIELRRGILSRSVLTAPLDRVRTVELTAKPIHRILGLSRVEIGTGSAARSDEGRVVLDSLGTEEARRLRAELLHRTPAADDVAVTGPDAVGQTHTEQVIMRFDPGWVRFAPLTTSGLVIALGTLAATGQIAGSVVDRAVHSSTLDDKVNSLPLVVVILGALVAFVLVISVLAIFGYMLTNWGFLLTRDVRARTFHIRRGLLTTRETSIDTDRLRGVEIHEPLGLRMAGGGRLNAIVTGFKKNAEGSTPLVPPAPRAVVAGVGEVVLGETGPLVVDLVQHGPAARRRRYVRGIVTTSVIPAALFLLVVTGDWPPWLAWVGLVAPVLGVCLARDRYARLGHALTPDYVVIRWGSLRGRRDALQRTGIIGWNIKQTFFQRRAGLVSLTATTAAGQQSYEILDVPEGVAVAFAVEAVPGLVEQFVQRTVRSAS
jgi:putative membrane protein